MRNPDRLPKRRNRVPLPTPAAAATSSMETASAPRSAISLRAASSSSARLRAASPRSAGAAVLSPCARTTSASIGVVGSGPFTVSPQLTSYSPQVIEQAHGAGRIGYVITAWADAGGLKFPAPEESASRAKLDEPPASG